LDIVPAGRISVADAYERLVQAAHRRRSPKRHEGVVDQSDPIVAALESDVESMCLTRMSDALRCGALRVFRRPAGWTEDATVSPKAFAKHDALAAMIKPLAGSDASTADERPEASETPCFLDEHDFELWLSAAMPKPPLRGITRSIDAQHWLTDQWALNILLADVPYECIDRDSCMNAIPQFLQTWAEKGFLDVGGIQTGQMHTTMIPSIEWQHMQIGLMSNTAKHHRFGERFYTDLIYHRGQLEQLLPLFHQRIAKVCLEEIEQPAMDGGSPPSCYSPEARAWIDQIAKQQPPAPCYVRPLKGLPKGLDANATNEPHINLAEPTMVADHPVELVMSKKPSLVDRRVAELFIFTIKI
jgi:hypothetical protein